MYKLQSHAMFYYSHKEQCQLVTVLDFKDTKSLLQTLENFFKVFKKKKKIKLPKLSIHQVKNRNYSINNPHPPLKYETANIKINSHHEIK